MSFFLKLLLFTLLSIIVSGTIDQTPKISEEIITDTYFGYHTLRAVVSRSTVEMIYAPDTTPHGYPSWPYMHVFGYDTVFHKSNYYVSNKAGYKNDYYLPEDYYYGSNDNHYRPSHIEVKKDTVLQFIKQIEELKINYRKDNGKKNMESLKVSNYEYYNSFNHDLAIGIIVNNIPGNTFFNEKSYYYGNWPYHEFTLSSKDDSRFGIYYPFFGVKDSTLRSVTYTFNTNHGKNIKKMVSYKYGLNKIDGQSKSFVTKIIHKDYLDCLDPYDYVSNNTGSYNSDYRDLFKIPDPIPNTRYCEEFCPPDSLLFFVDSMGRIVKRKTFYVPDDCSYGGYATTDSVFNSKGQLVIERPGHHYNGTTMGPPYTIKEFSYHDNGQISDIISDGTLSHISYNENGQVLMEKYIHSQQKDYKYDKHGNLILFSNNYCVDCDDSEDQIYTSKYEHIYNDKGLLIESYLYYYGNGDDMHNFALIDDNDIKRYLIAKYRYDEYDQIVRKEQYTESKSIYSHSIPRGNRYGLIHKLTTHEYKYYK
ncbi:hypothetical protein OAI93_00515 [bacterium]|nr:hypothetical protein [bacterium]